MKCSVCDTKLVSLYYREQINKKRKFVKIKQYYCKKCKKPTEVKIMNWFKE